MIVTHRLLDFNEMIVVHKLLYATQIIGLRVMWLYNTNYWFVWDVSCMRLITGLYEM